MVTEKQKTIWNNDDMKREILYRGFSIDSNQWVYGFYREYPIYQRCGKCLDHINYFIDLVGGGSEFVKPETVGQYTGLLDIDGVKIFEGDVVDYVCDGSRQGIIIYDNFGCVSIEFGDDEYLQTIDSRLLGTMEVIGNIQDNPELIKN